MYVHYAKDLLGDQAGDLRRQIRLVASQHRQRRDLRTGRRPQRHQVVRVPRQILPFDDATRDGRSLLRWSTGPHGIGRELTRHCSQTHSGTDSATGRPPSPFSQRPRILRQSGAACRSGKQFGGFAFGVSLASVGGISQTMTSRWDALSYYTGLAGYPVWSFSELMGTRRVPAVLTWEDVWSTSGIQLLLNPTSTRQAGFQLV